VELVSPLAKSLRLGDDVMDARHVAEQLKSSSLAKLVLLTLQSLVVDGTDSQMVKLSFQVSFKNSFQKSGAFFFFVGQSSG